MNIFLNKSQFIYWYKNFVNVRNSDMHFRLFAYLDYVYYNI